MITSGWWRVKMLMNFRIVVADNAVTVVIAAIAATIIVVGCYYFY